MRVKLTNTQLNKLKSAAKIKTWIILGLNKKNVEDEDLANGLFLTLIRLDWVFETSLFLGDQFDPPLHVSRRFNIMSI